MRNHQQNGPAKKAMESALELDDIKIPEYVLDGEKSKGENRHIPKSPMLVFINTKSGGQLGILLLETFHNILNSHQVFDLSKGQPDEVLQRVLQNMERLKTEGDEVAEEIRKSLKLVVAGGDGTAGWLLGIVSDLKLNDPPPIATIPLGTGNNLPFSFGWGKKNPGTDVESVKRFLRDVVDAHPLKVDSWHLIMTMDSKEDFEPEAPHSLHVFKKAEGKPQAFRGGFWNYFTIGMDAQVSYEFHTKRKEHPEKFKNQLRNQCTYAKLGCTQGWFFAPCMHPSSRNINDLATVFIAKRDGPWEELEISSGIRSLVLLNLPSFSGGLDPWGTPNDKKSLERGLTNPSVNDGLLELVGFRDGWHGMFLLFPNGHGTRLAQAHRVKIEFKRGANKRTYMRMDGEPWKQPLPDHEHGTVIEISHHGQAVMLAKEGCIAESKDDYEHTLSFTVKEGLEHGLHAKSTARQQNRKLHHQHDPELADDCDEHGDEAKRKFGASSTFKP